MAFPAVARLWRCSHRHGCCSHRYGCCGQCTAHPGDAGTDVSGTIYLFKLGRCAGMGYGPGRPTGTIRATRAADAAGTASATSASALRSDTDIPAIPRNTAADALPGASDPAGRTACRTAGSRITTNHPCSRTATVRLGSSHAKFPPGSPRSPDRSAGSANPAVSAVAVRPAHASDAVHLADTTAPTAREL